MIVLQVKLMTTLSIPQSHASIAMSVMGATELVSRIITSYVGDYFKGYMLMMYIVFTSALAITNFLAYLATTFTHLLIYGIGM